MPATLSGFNALTSKFEQLVTPVLCLNVSEMPIKFQSDRIILNFNSSAWTKICISFIREFLMKPLHDIYIYMYISLYIISYYHIIMGTAAWSWYLPLLWRHMRDRVSQITGDTTVCYTTCSNRKKEECSIDSPHEGSVMQETNQWHNVIMKMWLCSQKYYLNLGDDNFHQIWKSIEISLVTCVLRRRNHLQTRYKEHVGDIYGKRPNATFLQQATIWILYGVPYVCAKKQN